MNPTLKPPGTKRLKLKCDILLSNFAFKFNWRRYNLVLAAQASSTTLWVAARRRPTPAQFLRGAAIPGAPDCLLVVHWYTFTSFTSVTSFHCSSAATCVTPSCRWGAGAVSSHCSLIAHRCTYP
jgi:hypothetical protein